MQEISDVMLGLVSSASLGPMMDNLEDNYEKPLSLYKMAIILYKNSAIRWLAQSILSLTGNERMVKALQSMRPMDPKEYDTYVYR